MTLHAEDEMVQDGLTSFDVENALLTGEIVRRQRDSYRGEWKYVVEGRTLGSEIAVVVTKLAFSRKLVIITAQTLQVIERIKKLRQTVAPKRSVSVAVFE